MIILGIETSCDETAVAILNSDNHILSNKLFSQIDIHKKFGGVVPEIAARSHVEFLPHLVEEAFKEAKISINDINAIAATGGPGLIGAVMVGVMYGKTLASCMNKKFIAVNHLEGHALVPKMTENIEYPYLLLLVSGGHCQIVIIEELGKYSIISRTIDDAAGEAFDKVAKLLNIGYPGGPIVEQYAKKGNERAFEFPKPMLKKAEYNFSFSGLKTAVRNQIHKLGEVSEEDKADVCASFQYTVSKIINYKILQALKLFGSKFPNSKNIVISGGVAANQYLRNKLGENVKNLGYKLFYPPIDLCTDNAVMIAYAGMERLKAGFRSNLDFEPKSRWNLDEIIY
jgi:N6-L-threonylcarbamoyladenine synthase